MRKLMKPLLLSVGLVVCPALAICQQPVSATLSLRDARALARAHTPPYRQAIRARARGAESNLVTAVTQQYLTVLQARDNGEVARQQLDHDEQFLKLAQARYDVGRASLIDVRQAQVARGAAEVSLLRARTVVQ